jgi:adenylate kinase family enzyme
LHFDFGEALRASAKQQTGRLTRSERDVVEKSLRTGTLLENEHFSIAKKLLVNYLTKRKASEDTLVVLNGLPRHIGQAKAMEAVVEMQTLVSLECEPVIVWERIRINAGGDRGGRADDTLEEVEQRFEVFRRRTAPLLKYYRELGVPVLPLDVGVKTTAQGMRLQLEANWSRIVR